MIRTLPDDFTPLVRELHQRAAAIRQPVEGTFELTSRCNLGCRMCYVRHPAGDRTVRKQELSATAWLSLAREAADNGMVFLLLTGGEVFLRPDFFETYEPLTRMGLVLTLFTNGTLITPKIASRLAQSPPSRTEITIYGATAATYEAVTGIPGSYARCCDGIEALVTQNIPLVLKTTITRQNVGEVEAMRQMSDNWGLPFSEDWLLSKRRDGMPSCVEDCRLSPSDCVALEATNPAPVGRWTEIASRELAASNAANFYCDGGKSSFVVTPTGEMNVCLDLPLPAVRPLETGFCSAWKEVQRFVDSAPPISPTCLVCNARAYCPRCPARSFLENHTLTEPVPYLCDIAQARKERYSVSREKKKLQAL